jgi:hypothetical protein
MTREIEFGHQIRKSDTSTEIFNLLNGWRKAMDRYAMLQADDKGTQDDVAYWYGERANISFLAAGAWLSGFAALEEFRSERIRSRKKKNGRIDLYICNKDVAVEVEAKQRFVNMSKRAVLEKKITSAMKAAVKDAKSSRGTSVTLACAFFVPYYKRRKRGGTEYEADTEAVLEKHLNRYLAIKDINWAWSFPRCARDLCDSDKYGTYYMPGVVLGIQFIHSKRTSR